MTSRRKHPFCGAGKWNFDSLRSHPAIQNGYFLCYVIYFVKSSYLILFLHHQLFRLAWKRRLSGLLFSGCRILVVYLMEFGCARRSYNWRRRFGRGVWCWRSFCRLLLLRLLLFCRVLKGASWRSFVAGQIVFITARFRNFVRKSDSIFSNSFGL